MSSRLELPGLSLILISGILLLGLQAAPLGFETESGRFQAATHWFHSVISRFESGSW